MKDQTLSFLVAAVFLLFACFSERSFACTDFQIKTTDGAIIIGRSMEFASDVKSQIVVKPRQEREVGGSPDGKDGLVWTGKYGYVAINAFGIEETVIDGLNEAGLSIEGLWLPGTQYQTVSAEEASRAINAGRLGAWILGSFKKADEVKAAVKDVRIWSDIVPELDLTPPIHFAVHDAEGSNIVIEIIGGEIKVYDNPLGVMTNAPTFDWHLVNLRNYVNLTCQDSDPLKINGLTLQPTGHGSGLLGIPGDGTPPSRFVRTAMFVHFADPVKNAGEGVMLAMHILNTVDIPRGEIKGKTAGPSIEDYTQWVVIKDLTNKVLYVRDYNNLTLRAIDLKKFTFEPGMETRKIPVESKNPGIIDITDEILQ